MHTNQLRLSRQARVFWILGACVAVSSTVAIGRPIPSDIQARYLQERAVCLNGQSNQDRATCLQEAAAARAEALRGGLDSGAAAAFESNARSRCERVAAPDRQACLARMSGQGTTSGSVAAGGIYRELVTREVGQPGPLPPDTPIKPQ